MTSEQRGRAIVHARSYGGLCEVCGRPGHSLQHRVKAGQGGTWDPANLLRVCGDGTRYCHGWIEANPRHAMALGLWLHAVDDPTTVPAYIAPPALPRGWWLLDSDGMYLWVSDQDAYNAAAGPALTALRARLDFLAAKASAPRP
ncbi:HNH endonuclease [Pseudanabaena phage Pam4]|nr:HNH endonuclease [Pseudanabaena phage Pam4]